MPSEKNIVVIFKKTLFFNELINLIPSEKFQTKLFKNYKEITKNSNQKTFFL